MINRTCDHCDDTVYLPERGEQLEGYETPFEHFERTGHAHNEPTFRKCSGCGNVWPYSGNADRPTCPNCMGKNTESVE